jgi:3-polyprenyl-4-hydroxybenzoate decarboxylase
MRKDIPNAKLMDELKDEIPKPNDLKLFVTAKNYAVFGESTQRGAITQNCYRSIKAAGLPLPQWFRRDNGNYVTMGELPAQGESRWSKLLRGMAARSITA